MMLLNNLGAHQNVFLVFTFYLTGSASYNYRNRSPCIFNTRCFILWTSILDL